MPQLSTLELTIFTEADEPIPATAFIAVALRYYRVFAHCRIGEVKMSKFPEFSLITK